MSPLTPNARERREIAAAFRAAKRRLWNGQGPLGQRQMFICFALTETKQPGAYLAAAVVDSRLGRHAFLTHWLIAQGVPRADLTDAAVQAHRHAWLALLIKEFES